MVLLIHLGANGEVMPVRPFRAQGYIYINLDIYSKNYVTREDKINDL